MILISGLKRICDVCFYMTFASMLAWILGTEENLIVTLPIFVLTAFLSAFLAKYGVIKYIGLLPLILILLIITPSLLHMLIFIPIFLFLIWTMPNAFEEATKFEYHHIFKLFLIVFIATVLIFLLVVLVNSTASFNISQANIAFSHDVLLFAISFLIFAIIFMRLIRHDAAVLAQTIFKIMSSISVVALLFGAILLTSNAFIFLFRFIWVYGFGSILQGIAWLFTLPLRNITLTPLDISLASYCDDYDDCDEFYGHGGIFEDEVPTEYLTDFDRINWELVFFIMIIILIILTVILFKRLATKVESGVPIASGIKEERQLLNNGRRKKASLKQENNPIRAIYRKFLILLKKESLELDDHFTSFEVEKAAEQTFSSTKSSLLREAYIKVRYGEQAFTAADVNRVRELYKGIKKEIERK